MCWSNLADGLMEESNKDSRVLVSPFGCYFTVQPMASFAKDFSTKSSPEYQNKFQTFRDLGQ